MALPSTQRNEHPVDRLADLRAQVREIEAEIEDLRAQIIESGNFRGDHHLAQVKIQKRETLSRAKLDRKFGRSAVSDCCDTREIVILQTIPKK